ncbi:MAG: response regulator, partial [Leptospiraceae bacterium]|nr:response regulator [Leptospiraceae bacterium]
MNSKEQTNKPNPFSTDLSITNRRLIEKMLEMRTQSYLYSIRSSLLSETVFGLTQTKSSLAQVNYAFSDILNRISHEIRTQLHSIVGMLNLLMSDNEENMTPAQKALLDKINTVSLNLLNFTYLELQNYDDTDDLENKKKLKYSEFQVSELLREVMNELALNTHGESIIREKEYSQTKIWIYHDRILLKNIISYLGSMILDNLQEEDKASLYSEVEGVYQINIIYHLQIRDKKREEDLLGLFENTIMTTGLIFINNLIKLANAQVSYRKKGECSEFYLRIILPDPINEKEQLIQQYFIKLAENDPDSAPIVIYIDDNVVSLSLYKAIIEKHSSFKVITASGGKEGLKLLEKHHPTAILLDIRMPEMDGFEVIRILKKH